MSDSHFVSSHSSLAIQVYTPWCFYAGAVTGLIVTVAPPIVRTLLSRMAPAKSQGETIMDHGSVNSQVHANELLYRIFIFYE